MDPSVIEAIARWPNVPAVAGWLSLDSAGRWRLHPEGDADKSGPGEPISNLAIVAFIGRNYAHDAQGRWFFQNGPQRVYVRLDAAPFILRTGIDGSMLETHTGLPAGAVSAWYLDESHRLYADAEAGPGMIAGRDVAALMDAMRLENGSPALEAASMLQAGQPLMVRHPASPDAVALRRVPSETLPAALRFVAIPAVDAR
jgi:hypothetical protein